VTGKEHMVIDAPTEEIGRQIVDAGLKVHKALGPGLLESVYEHCLARELAIRGMSVRKQVSLPIVYEGEILDAGYRIDLLVSEAVIVEVKSVEALLGIHQAQLLTYLRLSGRRLEFLMNFNVALLKQGLKRLVL
jgi:GxxExxY protein